MSGPQFNNFGAPDTSGLNHPKIFNQASPLVPTDFSSEARPNDTFPQTSPWQGPILIVIEPGPNPKDLLPFPGIILPLLRIKGVYVNFKIFKTLEGEMQEIPERMPGPLLHHQTQVAESTLGKYGVSTSYDRQSLLNSESSAFANSKLNYMQSLALQKIVELIINVLKNGKSLSEILHLSKSNKPSAKELIEYTITHTFLTIKSVHPHQSLLMLVSNTNTVIAANTSKTTDTLIVPNKIIPKIEGLKTEDTFGWTFIKMDRTNSPVYTPSAKTFENRGTLNNHQIFALPNQMEQTLVQTCVYFSEFYLFQEPWKSDDYDKNPMIELYDMGTQKYFQVTLGKAIENSGIFSSNGGYSDAFLKYVYSLNHSQKHKQYSNRGGWDSDEKNELNHVFVCKDKEHGEYMPVSYMGQMCAELIGPDYICNVARKIMEQAFVGENGTRIISTIIEGMNLISEMKNEIPTSKFLAAVVKANDSDIFGGITGKKNAFGINRWPLSSTQFTLKLPKSSDFKNTTPVTHTNMSGIKYLVEEHATNPSSPFFKWGKKFEGFWDIMKRLGYYLFMVLPECEFFKSGGLKWDVNVSPIELLDVLLGSDRGHIFFENVDVQGGYKHRDESYGKQIQINSDMLNVYTAIMVILGEETQDLWLDLINDAREKIRGLSLWLNEHWTQDNNIQSIKRFVWELSRMDKEEKKELYELFSTDIPQGQTAKKSLSTQRLSKFKKISGERKSDIDENPGVPGWKKKFSEEGEIPQQPNIETFFKKLETMKKEAKFQKPQNKDQNIMIETPLAMTRGIVQWVNAHLKDGLVKYGSINTGFLVPVLVDFKQDDVFENNLHFQVQKIQSLLKFSNSKPDIEPKINIENIEAQFPFPSPFSKKHHGEEHQSNPKQYTLIDTINFDNHMNSLKYINLAYQFIFNCILHTRVCSSTLYALYRNGIPPPIRAVLFRPVICFDTCSMIQCKSGPDLGYTVLGPSHAGEAVNGISDMAFAQLQIRTVPIVINKDLLHIHRNIAPVSYRGGMGYKFITDPHHPAFEDDDMQQNTPAIISALIGAEEKISSDIININGYLIDPVTGQRDDSDGCGYSSAGFIDHWLDTERLIKPNVTSFTLEDLDRENTTFGNSTCGNFLYFSNGKRHHNYGMLFGGTLDNPTGRFPFNLGTDLSINKRLQNSLPN